MRKSQISTPLLKKVTGMLDATGCPYIMDSAGFLTGLINGKNGNWNFKIHVLDEAGQAAVRMSSLLPAKVFAARQSEVLEFLNRLNANFAVGHFFIHHDEGLVCFFASIELMDGQLTQEMFRKMFFTNLNTVDSHFTEIMSIAYGQMSAADVYQAYERIHLTPIRVADSTLQ